VIVEKPGFDFTLVIVLQNGALTARLGSADFLRFLLSKKKKGFKILLILFDLIPFYLQFWLFQNDF